MALSITHATVAVGTDAGNGEIHKAEWNQAHSISGTLSADDTVDGTTNKVFTATEKTKLSGIEALADVTDAANVDAAGAVMNSDTSTASMSFVDNGTVATNSTTKVPTQAAVKTYADSSDAAYYAAALAACDPVTTFTTVSPSGTAAVTVTSIARDAVFFGINGVSHGDGTTRHLELHYSTNNGGSWTLWGNLTVSALGAAAAVFTGMRIDGLKNGTASTTYPAVQTAGTAIMLTAARSGTVTAGAQIDALKLQWATGVNFDAGTVYVKVTD